MKIPKDAANVIVGEIASAEHVLHGRHYGIRIIATRKH